MGERWALLVVRELLLGPKRFTDLRAGLPAAEPRRPLPAPARARAAGVVSRRQAAAAGRRAVYELTERGRELEPVVLALGRWGSVAPFPPAERRQLGADALVVALKTLFDPAAPQGRRRVRAAPGRATASAPASTATASTVERGGADTPDAVIAADPPALAGALWHGRPLDAVAIAGDRRRATRFLRRFPLPADG